MKNDVLTGQLLLNWIARVLFFVSMAALLPTLPNYIVTIGGSNSQVGIVMSAFAVGVLLFRPLIGKQVDTVGRKIVLLIGIVIFIISPIIYIFIESVGIFIPVRIFHGLGLAAFGTASITLITDAAPLNKRGEVLSYTGMVNTIAFALGPILGSYIGDRWGYPTLFTYASSIAAGCFLFSLFLRETKKTEISTNNISYLQAIKHRRILLAALIVLLIAMTHGAVFIYFPIFLKRTLDINIGTFFFVFGLATLVIRVFIGRVADRWGRGPLIVFALTFMIIGVLLFREADNLPVLFTGAVIYGFGFGAQQPTLTALVADNSENETRGKVFSFYYGGFDLGISITGIVLGAAAEAYGIANMFLLCGVITALALIIFTFFFEKGVRTSLQHAFSLEKPGEKCDLCDQYMEETPEQAEEYFRKESKL